MSHFWCVLILLAFLFGPALVMACCMAAQKKPEFNIFGGGGGVDGHASASAVVDTQNPDQYGQHNYVPVGCLTEPAGRPRVSSEIPSAGIKPGPLPPTNFGNKPMDGRVAMELQDRIENHKL